MALERAPEEFISSIAREQYDSVYNLYARRFFYKNAVPAPIDFEANAIAALKLDGNETILDVGCGGANVLSALHSAGHQGPLVGVEIDANMFAAARSHDAVTAGHIDLRIGAAQNLGLPDNSVDCLLALFLLYHIDEPAQALAEFKRVLKPGGQILVATSGVNNKRVHRLIEDSLAQLLATTPPTVFAEPFNDVVAARVLPQWFDEVKHLPALQGEVHLRADDPNSHANYFFSLQSMMRSYGRYIRYGAEWKPLIDTYVEPRILTIEALKGHFTDYYDLHYFKGVNNKPYPID